MSERTERFLSPAAVEWEGNEGGYRPSLSSEDERAAAALEREDVPALVDALADADRFVKAHVGLTRVTGVRHETFPTWNGLEVALRADGAVAIDPRQRETLAARWRVWLASDPRPDELPAA